MALSEKWPNDWSGCYIRTRECGEFDKHIGLVIEQLHHSTFSETRGARVYRVRYDVAQINHYAETPVGLEFHLTDFENAVNECWFIHNDLKAIAKQIVMEDNTADELQVTAEEK